MANTPVTVYADAFLSNKTNYVSRTVSAAIATSGNTVVVEATLKNIAGSHPVLTLDLEGSFDGTVWETTNLTSGSVTFSSPTPPAVLVGTAVAQKYHFLRLRATITADTTDGLVLFSATLTLSDQ